MTNLVNRNIGLIDNTWHRFIFEKSEKLLILTDIHNEIGFGGMIHNFKNYVLRHDNTYIEAAHQESGGVLAGMAQKYLKLLRKIMPISIFS